MKQGFHQITVLGVLDAPPTDWRRNGHRLAAATLRCDRSFQRPDGHLDQATYWYRLLLRSGLARLLAGYTGTLLVVGRPALPQPPDPADQLLIHVDTANKVQTP